MVSTGNTNYQIHKLKTWPLYFEEVLNGTKTFEVRKNDRDFKVGDYLELLEYNPEHSLFTGRSCTRAVVYILQGGQFGIQEGYVIMGIKTI